MVVVKVLGSGCTNCKRTKVLIKQVIEDLALDAQVEEVTGIGSIMAYGVMATPAIVVDERVVHAGGVPQYGEVVTLLQQA